MLLMTATSARSTGLDLRFCRFSRKPNFGHPRCFHDPRVFYVAEDTSSWTAVASHSYRGHCHKFHIIDIPTPYGFILIIQLVVRKSFSKPRISIPVDPTLLCLSTQTRRRYTTGLQLQSYEMHPHIDPNSEVQETELSCRLVKRFQTFADKVQKFWSTRMMRCGMLVNLHPSKLSVSHWDPNNIMYASQHS